MKASILRLTIASVALAAGFNVFAGQELMSVDSQFRAKIAKEKIRMAAQKRDSDSQGNTSNKSSCGSQSIGNVDTGGRIGAAPREVFVFAPNAINIVGQGGCQ